MKKAFVQYKSHQAHRREQDATGEKRERTTEGFMKRRKEREPGTFSRPHRPKGYNKVKKGWNNDSIKELL